LFQFHLKALKLISASAFILTGISSYSQTTFSYTGSLQTYTVPAGVTQIRLECWGAQGSGGNGGNGGYARGDMNVTPGQVLNVYVGTTSNIPAQTTIDISGLSSGTYLLTLKSASKAYTETFIKQ
jgi:hypothetical protein